MLYTNYSVAINPNPGDGELTVLFAGRSQTEPVHTVGPQVLDYYLLHYIISGKGVFHCRGREHHLSQGDSFFIHPGELVSYASDEKEPWKYRWVACKGALMEKLLPDIRITPLQPVGHSTNPRRTNVLFHKIQQVLQRSEAMCDYESNGYLRILLSQYNYENRKNSNKEKISEIRHQVDHAIRWLTLQYSQPVSIDKMAQELGYHRTHLSKMFKQHTGTSPMQFLLKIRMERAKLLMQEPLTIQQIASSVGFSDALYFSKQFKKWYGLSPTEYRTLRQIE